MAMKSPQIRLRTILVLMAALAALFAIGAKWPVEVTYPMSYEVEDAPGTWAYRVEVQADARPPTLREFLIRVGISLGSIALAITMIVAVARGAGAVLRGELKRNRC